MWTRLCLKYKMLPKNKKLQRITAKVHTKIDTPLALRKLILESAIDATKLEQYTSGYSTIKKQKLEQQALFKKTIKDIKQLFQKIQIESLPELPEKKQQKEKFRPGKTMKKEIHKIEQPTKPDKFEQELEEIQKKLNKLNF